MKVYAHHEEIGDNLFLSRVPEMSRHDRIICIPLFYVKTFQLNELMFLGGYYSFDVFTLNASVAAFSCLLVSLLESVPEKKKKWKEESRLNPEAQFGVLSSASVHMLKTKKDLFGYVFSFILHRHMNCTCAHSERMG